MELEDAAHAAHENIEQDVSVANTTHDHGYQTNDPSNEPDAEMSDANNDEESDDEEGDGEDVEPVAKHMADRKAVGGKKEAKRPGKESGRLFKCYGEGCDKIYTRRRTVCDHMIKEHGIQRAEFEPAKCKEVKYTDDTKKHWVEVPPRDRKRKSSGRRTQKSLPTNTATPNLQQLTADQVSAATNMAKSRKRKASSDHGDIPLVAMRESDDGIVSTRDSPASPPSTDDEAEPVDNDSFSNDDRSVSDNGEEYPEELYCICRKPDDGTPMVCCDGCDEWYHVRCIGQHKDEVQNLLVKFYCGECVKNKKGDSIFRLKCAIDWCRKPSTPESKYKFCCDQHHQDYIEYLLKRSDAAYDIKSRDGKALFAAWKMRQKNKHGKDWEPNQVYKLVDGIGRLTVKDSELPNLGGQLRVEEVKSLVNAVTTIEEFKKLGAKGAKPIEPLPRYSIKVQNYLTHDENGEATDAHKFAILKDILDQRRQVLNKAKMLHKKGVCCGYDARLAMTNESFVKAMAKGPESYDPCLNPACRQHFDWVKNETRVLAHDAVQVRELATNAGIRLV